MVAYFVNRQEFKSERQLFNSNSSPPTSSCQWIRQHGVWVSRGWPLSDPFVVALISDSMLHGPYGRHLNVSAVLYVYEKAL